MLAALAHFNQQGSLYVTRKHPHLTSLGRMTNVRQTSPAHMERAGLEVKPGPRSENKVTASVQPTTWTSARQLPFPQRTKSTTLALGNVRNNVPTHSCHVLVHLESTPANVESNTPHLLAFGQREESTFLILVRT